MAAGPVVGEAPGEGLNSLLLAVAAVGMALPLTGLSATSPKFDWAPGVCPGLNASVTVWLP